MAEELKIKIKVDASEVTKGTDDAKSKVKQSADEMKSEVSSASASMEKDLDKVADSAKGIESAASQAGSAVKNLEGQVSQSAEKMSSDLKGVGEQIKGISGRQIAGLASRGFGVAGRLAKGIGENFAETEEGKAGWNTAGAALEGAASGVALGGAIGSIVPVVGTAVGAAVGAAVGGLVGAASELLTASRELDKAAKDWQKNSEKSLQDHAADLRERERFAGYDRQNQVLLNGIGKSWYGDKTGTDRVFEVANLRQQEVDRISKERDDYIRAHQNDTGDEAKHAAAYLAIFDKELLEAQQHLQALAPVIDAARKAQAEAAKAEAEKQKKDEAYSRASAGLNAAIEQYVAKQKESELKDQYKEGQRTISGYERELNGAASIFGKSAASDSLTKIGGGVGYASYNNSVVNYQKSVENNLKKLIENQTNQNNAIISELQKLQNGGSDAAFG